MTVQKKKTAVLVDSACDLPQEYIDSNDIHVIPVNVEFEDTRFKDERDEEQSIRFYRKYKKHKTAKIESRPSTPDQIRNFILKHIAPVYEQALILCISSTRSETYNNALTARLELLEVLRGSHDKSLFQLRDIEVVDTRTVFTGQAVVAYCVNNIIELNPDLSTKALITGCNKIAPDVKTFIVLKDLFYANHRGKLRNERSIGTLAYVLGKGLDVKPILCVQNGETTRVGKARGFDKALSNLFSIAKQDISMGIKIPTIMLSYAGSLERITKRKEYKEFVKFAENNQVSLLTSVMSTTAGIYVGPGAISLSYC